MWMKSYNRDLEIGLCPQHSIPEIHPGVCVLVGVGGGVLFLVKLYY